MNKKSIGTFTLNKKEPIHRWYKYDEGYSSQFIYNEIDNLPFKINSLFEPFAGSGTTPLVASSLGIDTYYTETNPFMRFVTNTKIEVMRKTILNKDIIFLELKTLINHVELMSPSKIEIDGDFKKFYREEVYAELNTIKEYINNLQREESRDLAHLALASIAIKVSNMKKHGDLRYAKENEKKESDFDVKFHYINKLNDIIDDIDNYQGMDFGKAICVGEDARDAKTPYEVDCLITSPPYLNGTNYIRNTKLELNMLGFINKESELKNLHSKGIIAGINNVSKRIIVENKLNILDEILEELAPVSYDSRLSKMIVGYFNNMAEFFENASRLIKNKGIMIIDIGDSQFAGVHIPTDKLLNTIAKSYGFILYDEEILRTRYSKNRMILTQKVLRYRLEKGS